MLNLVSFKPSQTSEYSSIDELFETLGDLILEMRYDVKELEKKSHQNRTKTYFNIFLKNQYQINKSLRECNTSSNQSLSINFHLQKKENAFSLMVESWNFYIIKAKSTTNFELSNLSRARICLFLRSVLCLLTILPLWSNFIVLNEKNINKKQYFIDHELVFHCKEKQMPHSNQNNYKEIYQQIETENFLLIFKISYINDFSFFENNNKIKPKFLVINKAKRERFLSEGTFEENLIEKNETPLRFFAQWGIEGDISTKKVPNHFKVHQKFQMNDSQKSFEQKQEEIEIEIIDSEQDLPNAKKKSLSFDENEENDQFELITEDTEFERKFEIIGHNSDFQIIGNENENEFLKKILEKCKNCQKKIESFETKVKMEDNFNDLKRFLKTLD